MEVLHPLNNAEPIVPSDTVNHVPPYEAIYFGTGGGDAEIIANSGQVMSIIAVTQGVMLRIRFKRVNLTFTTAVNMVGLW